MTFPLWLSAAWPHLVQGRRVVIPVELHPVVRTWGMARIAEDVGQGSNYVLSLPDGSRVHVHGFADGRMIAHRDRWDPARSPVHAAAHVVTETTTGRVVGGAGLLGAAAWLLLV